MTNPETKPRKKRRSGLKSLKSFRLWLGLALSGGSILFLVSSINPDQVASALGSANYLLVIPSIAMVFVTMFLKAIRWQLLFGSDKPPIKKLYSSLLIGYMANAILPARLGEVVRAYNIGRSSSVSTSKALSTIVVEKVLDIATVLIILILLIPIAPLPDWAFRMGVVGAAVVVVLLLVSFALVLYGDRVAAIAGRVGSQIPYLKKMPVEKQVASFAAGFDVLRRGRLALPIIFWSIVIWLGAAAINYVMLLAFDPHAPLVSALFVLAVTNLGMAVPSAPSYIGVFHYLVVISLAVFGISQSLALSYAIVLHVATFGSFVVSGLILMWREQFSLSMVDPDTLQSQT